MSINGHWGCRQDRRCSQCPGRQGKTQPRLEPERRLPHPRQRALRRANCQRQAEDRSLPHRRAAGADASERPAAEKPELAILDGDTFGKAQTIKASRGRTFKAGKERHGNQSLFPTLIQRRECG